MVKGGLRMSNVENSSKCCNSYWIDCHRLAIEGIENLMELGDVKNMEKPEYNECLEVLEKIVDISYKRQRI